MPSARPRSKPASGPNPLPWFPLMLLLLIPGGALARSIAPEHALATIAALLGVSGFSYLLYAEDKHRAQNGAWRIPESVLQLCALLGGWPGAFAAQQRLRHKTAKGRFLFLFWLIVAAHQVVALDGLLGWPGRDDLLAALGL